MSSSLYDALLDREPTQPSDDSRLQPQSRISLAEVRMEKVRRAKQRRQLLRSLKAFTEYFWDVLEPDVPLVWNWHLDVLCDELDLIENTPNAQEIFNVPPGTGKSLILVFYRGKLWARNAGLRFLNASYSDRLSERDNVKLRNLILSDKYRRMFPHVIFKGDQNVKQKFETTAGGWSFATSVNGAGTGEHPDYKFIDDPITEQQSRSDAEREAANAWIDRTLSSRGVARGARTLLIMQRLHKDDPTGHVLAKGGWRHTCFPMRYELCECEGNPRELDEESRCVLHKADINWEPDPRDIRTEPGELLMPQLFDEEKVRNLEIALGPFGTAGQLQQRPQPEGGGFFKREWFKFLDAPPLFPKRKVRGWDTGATEKNNTSCPTVGVKMSMVEIAPPTKTTPGHYHYVIEDVVLEHTTSPDSLIRSVAEMDGKDVEVFEEREGGSSGKVVINQRHDLMRGYAFRGVTLTGDKVTRAKPFRSQVEAGNVYLVRAAWNEAYLSELADFPVGKFKDQVDGSSCAFNGMMLEKPKPKGGVIGGRK